VGDEIQVTANDAIGILSLDLCRPSWRRGTDGEGIWGDGAVMEVVCKICLNVIAPLSQMTLYIYNYLKKMVYSAH
jgi:hypothetical protein